MTQEIKNIGFDHAQSSGLEFDIFTLDRVLQPRELDHNPHHHHRVNFYILLFITGGKGIHTIDFQEFKYAKGSVLTIRKDQIHKFHPCKAEGYALLFTEEFALSYLEKQGATKIMELFNELLFSQHTKLDIDESRDLLTLVHQMEQEFNSAFDDHTSGIIRNLLQISISKIHRCKSVGVSAQMHKYTEPFLDFQGLVEAHCVESKSVQYYADRLHVTSKTLNNITREIVDKSAKTFIDETLILQIKRALINSRLSVKEIAYQSGFDEPTNLFKFFKRFTDQTPESFRTMHAS